MTSPDDDIIAALRESPGDPPPTDLYGKVSAGVRRRRRRHRAVASAGMAACMAVAIAVVPMVLRDRGSAPAPPSGLAAPSCAATLESQPAVGPAPAGSGFAPGTPSSAVLCEYDQTAPSGRLMRRVDLDARELAKTLRIVRSLTPTNKLPSCPARPTMDLLTFGYLDGATVTLRIGCIVGQGDLVALLNPSLDAEIRNLLVGVPTVLPSSALTSGTPSPSPLPSMALPSISLPSSVAANGPMLFLDDQQRFALIDPSFSTPRLLSLAAIPSGPSLIASNPAGGWVVTYTPDPVASPGAAPIRLALIDASGKATPFGLTYQSAYVTGLAVSPDGTKVAIALMGQTASIVVMPMPGHSGKTETWPTDDNDVNEIISLSWAPDSSRLAYIAGSQTGAGIGGSPSILDTSKPGKAPTQSTWPASTGCDETAVSWLSTAFAVVEECASTGVAYRRADVTTGASLGPTIALPQVGCGMPPMHPSRDGSNVLIPWCGTLYLISDGAATPIGQHVVDAAWGG
jgi:hypothetical protein